MNIQESFESYFQNLGYSKTEQSKTFLPGDASLLFTNSGMNQFKAIINGESEPVYSRTYNIQDCIRAGGKHNDLEDVGKDGRHLTFFQMMGNWGFRSCLSKSDAIKQAWDYVTSVLNLDISRIYVTTHIQDDQAYSIWVNDIGLDPSRILKLDEDNFWSMGYVGLCGPCTEIHYDLTPELPFEWTVGYDSDRVVEFWNLVFIEFDKQEDGTLSPLPFMTVDTGMGYERLVMIREGKKSVFDTSIFQPYFEYFDQLPSRHRETECVVIDHLRSICHALADGARFGRNGRDSVLRNLFRRAYYKANQFLGLTSLLPVAMLVLNQHSRLGPYTQTVLSLIEEEEKSFQTKMQTWSNIFITKVQKKAYKEIPPSLAFDLVTTYGIPFDMVRLYLSDNNISLNEDEYYTLFDKHRVISRNA